MQALTAHLRAHHGVISRSEAESLGLTRSQIDQRLRNGRWERVAPSVFRVAGAPPTWLGDARAAALSVDGLVSHRAAARIWRLDGFQRARIELTTAVARGPRVAVRAVMHRSTQMHLAGLVERRSVPVTGIARTVLDLGGVVPFPKLEQAVDAALRLELLTWQDLRHALVVHSRRGRNGCGALRALLEERFGDSAVPDSRWNRMVGQLLVAAGLPEPEFEFEIRTSTGRFVARVDLAYPDAGLAIECDSLRYHLHRRAFESDRRRSNAVQNLGWRVLSFTWTDYASRPDDLVATVRTALRRIL